MVGVLIVEDDPWISSLLVSFLEAEGYTVRRARHGGEALEQTEEQQPDIILLDMMMPVMDGWEFARCYRSRWGWTVPMIVMTASGCAHEWGEQVGADAVLSKPFDLEQLLMAIEQILQERREQAA